MIRQRRLVIVSNRLPVVVEGGPDRMQIRPSSGGLVSALLPLCRAHGGCWIGWPGAPRDPALELALREGACGCDLEPVFLTEDERRRFYCGFSNEILWPLFHDLQSQCDFGPGYWSSYCEVTEKYADAVERVVDRPDTIVWVHDYHLMMLAESLRSRGLPVHLAYFHHIPFPGPDIFEKLPWRAEILRGLLRYDTVAFQTVRDRRNFLACVRRLLPNMRLFRAGARYLVRGEQRSATITSSPIGIDYQSLSTEAAGPAVEENLVRLREGLHGLRLVLGVDRLDYTKGILQRLAAFRSLLENRPEWRGRVALVQVLVPSREDVPSYRRLRLSLEQHISDINGEFGDPAWTPVRHMHRHLTSTELLALYRAADVALVTPIRDGMNLVAKEFCAARTDERGVLVLSEFAGAAAELKTGALLINPYDIEDVALRLEQALTIPPVEQARRMRAMRQVVAAHDVFRWCGSLLGQLSSGTRAPRTTPIAKGPYFVAAPAV